jgi:hypothetical protein
MSWCKKRITNKELLIRFADGKHRFYLESVCGGPIKEGNLCSYCLSLTTQTKTQDVTTFPHGLVTGKYTDESHIYDSPWYHKKVEAYGAPSKEHLELAMEAQQKARSGVRVKSLKDIFTQIHDTAKEEQPLEKEVTVVKDTVESQKPARKPRKPKAADTPSEPVSEAQTIEPQKKARKPRAKKTEITPAKEAAMPQVEEVNILKEIPAQAEYIENMNDIVTIDTVIKVYLKIFTVNGIKYFRDPEREKIYTIAPQQRVGKYIGRWNAELEKIISDAPDSDCDE